MTTSIYHEETNEFLGNVAKTSAGWQAQTIFGYPMAQTDTREQAERIVRETGLTYLDGIWHYYDKDEHDWFPCVIKEAYEHRVIVIRTNELGYQEPERYKYVTIKDPAENTLVKAS